MLLGASKRHINSIHPTVHLLLMHACPSRFRLPLLDVFETRCDQHASLPERVQCADRDDDPENRDCNREDGPQDAEKRRGHFFGECDRTHGVNA